MTESESHDEIVEKHENYGDTVSVTVTEHAAIRARSDLLSINIDTYDKDDLVCGVTVNQEGTDIAIKGGTISDAGDALPSLYTWNGLTVEQAREVADGLHEAADEVELLQEEYDEVEEKTQKNSIIKRILS